MKYLTTLTFAMTLIASQAAALSCIRPDVARTFQNVAAAEERFVVLFGSFDFPPQRRQPVSNDAEPQQVVATFEDQGLGAAGFVATQPKPVTLQTACAGPWCGGFPTPGQTILAFIEQTDQGDVLTLSACGGLVFDADTAPIVEACMRGEPCEEGPLRR